MVVPIVSAVAPTVIASATDSDGLVNQAFKITVLIALALAVGTGIFLIYMLTDVLGLLGELFGSGGAIGTLFSLALGPFGAGFTVLTSSFMR